jgi:hypothetical protein
LELLAARGRADRRSAPVHPSGCDRRRLFREGKNMHGEKTPRALGRKKSVGEKQACSVAFARRFGHVRAVDQDFAELLATRHAERCGVSIEIARRIVAAVAISMAITAQPDQERG